MRVVHWYPNFLAGGGVANSVLALANAQAAAGADTWIASLAHKDPIYGPLQPDDGVRLATWGTGRTLRWGGLRLHALGRGQAAFSARLRRTSCTCTPSSIPTTGGRRGYGPARSPSARTGRSIPRFWNEEHGASACTSRWPGVCCTRRSPLHVLAQPSRPTSPGVADGADLLRAAGAESRGAGSAPGHWVNSRTGGTDRSGSCSSVASTSRPRASTCSLKRSPGRCASAPGQLPPR